MFDWLSATPGRLYVVGTLLPLIAFVVQLAAGTIRGLCRPFRQQGRLAAALYWAFGGDQPVKVGAYWATGCMAAAAAVGIVGLVLFLNDTSPSRIHAERWSERIDWIRIGAFDSTPPNVWEERYYEWQKQGEMNGPPPAPPTAVALELGYRIDHLTAVVFVMVTVIGTLIFIFSLGYMRDETQPQVEDHQVDQHNQDSTDHGPNSTPSSSVAGHHFTRRGRFGRFFLYLSLFCFAMLNLVIADNLFQVFVSWELVGVCSFFLIGFYYERKSAAVAANKAFIVNRVGDAGFLIGILIAWSYLGTLNFEEMTRRVRSPVEDSHGALAFANQFVRVNPAANDDTNPQSVTKFQLPPKDDPSPGTHLALFPLAWETPDHYHGLGYKRSQEQEFLAPVNATINDFGAIPYWLFVVMGLGIFLGCVGKSAQVPLHTWLPDAMEGPTPVSALIHAATMVAAGVYLVGRSYPLLAPEVLLVIAYVGAVTLFISASIALVQTDIKRVLAYSTCSQLGFMMLALGIGAWVAGLLHLITHAFFKALLFLCSGSVIHGCHHEQDLRKMGGLRAKMPITTFTMLIGVLAICGAPLLSGWYSKDMILAASLAYVSLHPEHLLLFALPAVTAAMTAYYMFRLWFLAFTGQPRDAQLCEKVHESPAVMTLPLIVLAIFSVVVAWGWPLWQVEASALAHVLHQAEPASVKVAFYAEKVKEHEVHGAATVLALIAALVGAGLAFHFFYRREPTLARLTAPAPAWYNFLLRKWYFDEVYDAAFVEPTVELARFSAAVDKRSGDGATPAETDESTTPRYDWSTLDGILNAVGQLLSSLGAKLRAVQTGGLRTYITALALTATVLLAMLAVLTK